MRHTGWKSSCSQGLCKRHLHKMCILGAKYILVHVLLLKFHLSDLHNFHILDILGMLPHFLEYVKDKASGWEHAQNNPVLGPG